MEGKNVILIGMQWYAIEMLKTETKQRKPSVGENMEQQEVL